MGASFAVRVEEALVRAGAGAGAGGLVENMKKSEHVSDSGKATQKGKCEIISFAVAAGAAAV